MDELIATHESAIRLGSFLGIFALMALWEILAPRRPLSQSKTNRWLNNILLVVFNTALLRVVFPVAAIGVAEYAQLSQWGLFNLVPAHPAVVMVTSVIVLDMAIYLQHVMFHAVPLLWRLHRVHHADLDFDVTTGARFHPIEILLSMLIKFAVIVLLGPPLAAVVIFEVLLNAMAMFNHSNVRMPLALDSMLRRLIVTPDMHRVHHSRLADETNSNFGFNLSAWDRIFGTYRAQPAAGHTDMVIGIDTFRDPAHCVKISGLLFMPFTGRITDYAINRRWHSQDEH
jgi:sterol desaturase/sphingolipid hydroxylase (fatty acid hydroxylase superfamily)